MHPYRAMPAACDGEPMPTLQGAQRLATPVAVSIAGALLAMSLVVSAIPAPSKAHPASAPTYGRLPISLEQERLTVVSGSSLRRFRAFAFRLP
jgi:hypothetical protein